MQLRIWQNTGATLSVLMIIVGGGVKGFNIHFSGAKNEWSGVRSTSTFGFGHLQDIRDNNRILNQKTSEAIDHDAVASNDDQLIFEREAVVRRYFEGVTEKDREKIRSCFATTCSIRDVCRLREGNSVAAVKVASRDEMADRCMEFVAAHPDCVVRFHYGPICDRRPDPWVFAHWYETGTWSGESCGIKPKNTPLNVEGQTRFRLDEQLKITDLVVTRTFTEWERLLTS